MRQPLGLDTRYDRSLDCLGLLCPLPVLKARKTLSDMAPHAVLRLLADDPMAAIDVPHFCAESGHIYQGAHDVPGGAAYFIARRDEA